MNDEASDILKLLLEAHPNSVSETSDQEHDENLELPIHKAAKSMSPGCCKVLVDAYPESVKTVDRYGYLPFHHSCMNGRPDTVEYLLKMYPESLHIGDNCGYLPIHCAAGSPGENTAEIVNFLLRHDPDCVSKQVTNQIVSSINDALPLYLVCSYWGVDQYNVTELLYDLYPEAILVRNGSGQLPFDILRNRDDEMFSDRSSYDVESKRRNTERLAFLSSQMSFAYKSKDETAMRTRDRTGSLPLHKAIRDDESLGTIKLLVKGNPEAVDIPDRRRMLPLDIASEDSTVGVVKYLAELSPDRLNRCDENNNYPLHHACRGGNCEVIQYLLERPKSSASVSERNAGGILPIHLFCKFVNEQEQEEEEVEDDEEDDNAKYTETIWRLLTAYPETVLNW